MRVRTRTPTHPSVSLRPTTPAQTSAPCSGRNTRPVLGCRSGRGVCGWPGSSVPCKGEMTGLQDVHTRRWGRDLMGGQTRYGTCRGIVPRHMVDERPTSACTCSTRVCAPAPSGCRRCRRCEGDFLIFHFIFRECACLGRGRRGERKSQVAPF